MCSHDELKKWLEETEEAYKTKPIPPPSSVAGGSSASVSTKQPPQSIKIVIKEQQQEPDVVLARFQDRRTLEEEMRLIHKPFLRPSTGIIPLFVQRPKKTSDWQGMFTPHPNVTVGVADMVDCKKCGHIMNRSQGFQRCQLCGYGINH